MSSTPNETFLSRLDRIDRRWIFLMMALAVAGPIIWVGITGKTFPEKATPAVQGAFDAIEKLPENARVLISFDYDPASAGELQPMATSFVHHCALRHLRIVGMTLWAPGSPLIGSTFTDVIGSDPFYRYGETYADLGYQAGNEGVMKQMGADFAKAFPNDSKGTPVGRVPLLKGIERLEQFDMLISVSAGYPGSKEWVQYGVSPTLTGGKPLPFVTGTTGVQTPQMIPYYPVQMPGILGAIKGAAEYESLVNTKMSAAKPGEPVQPRFQEAQRRMAPQLVAHTLMVALILVGNVIYFAGRRKGSRGMSQLNAPLQDPAIERRANRMMMAVLAVICGLLVLRAVIGSSVGNGDAQVTEHGFGMVYVQESPQGFVAETVKEKAADGTEKDVRTWKPAAPGQQAEISWTEWNEVTAAEWAEAQHAKPGTAPVVVSWPRTAGVWFAALMTLAVLSFLWRDNPIYKLAESLVVGVSAGYWMIVSVWDTMVPKLAGALAPAWTKAHLMPSLDAVSVDWFALVPLFLGFLLLCRLSNRASWLGTFPLAFVVGTFAGLKFTQYVEADLLGQIATMFQPLVVVKHSAVAGADAAAMAAAPIDWAGTVGASTAAILVFVGVLSVLAYFFFSLEHKGALGRTAKVGVWYLMITFGASFGFTVMGRIALLAARFEFLFDDWLWLIDPSGKH